jgi:murein endopeptidase
MKNTRYAVWLMASLALCVSAAAQTKEMKTQPAVSGEQHDMQSATPGAEHSSLAKLAGDYTTATRFFMQPSATPAESTGTA